MKANELRIGIWVYLFGDAVQLTKDHLIYLLQKDGLPEPITLTPEWLKRFGFHRQTENHYYIFYMDKVLITIYNGSLVIEGGFMPLDLKYVHQLQNLYWSLCGEELTIVSPAQIQPPRKEAQEP